jgi:hypothetical protein
MFCECQHARTNHSPWRSIPSPTERARCLRDLEETPALLKSAVPLGGHGPVRSGTPRPRRDQDVVPHPRWSRQSVCVRLSACHPTETQRPSGGGLPISCSSTRTEPDQQPLPRAAQALPTSATAPHPAQPLERLHSNRVQWQGSGKNWPLPLAPPEASDLVGNITGRAYPV